jgi:acetyl-CoA acetyltransferase
MTKKLPLRDVYVLASYCTVFGKRPDSGFKDLTRETYLGVLADARLASGEDIDQVWFGNCGMGTFGQRNIRGHVCFTPLIREKLFPERVSIINVEGGCATASMAFHGAYKDILSGQAELSLAIGVEKTYLAQSPEKTKEIFEGGIDQLDPHEWIAYYKAASERSGKPFDHENGQGSLFMDTYAMQAAFHMKTYGTTVLQIAQAASKNHFHGSMNPKAQYRFELSPEEVLADRLISFPLTRAMCAPIGDGAAAALLCSADYLDRQAPEIRRRAVKVRANALTSGKYRRLDEPGLSSVAAKKAYQLAGLTAHDIDLAEVHDATSFCEIFQCESLGFCEAGEGGAFVGDGHTKLGGTKPINLSGGLVSKGHPVGATGLSMIDELVTQLRGEASERQAKQAQFALAENGGGVIGFDEAACSITILEANALA